MIVDCRCSLSLWFVVVVVLLRSSSLFLFFFLFFFVLLSYSFFFFLFVLLLVRSCCCCGSFFFVAFNTTQHNSDSIASPHPLHPLRIYHITSHLSHHHCHHTTTTPLVSSYRPRTLSIWYKVAKHTNQPKKQSRKDGGGNIPEEDGVRFGYEFAVVFEDNI